MLEFILRSCMLVLWFDKSSTLRDTGEVSAGKDSACVVRAGEVSAGEVSAGEVSTGIVSAGEVSAGVVSMRLESKLRSDMLMFVS